MSTIETPVGLLLFGSAVIGFLFGFIVGAIMASSGNQKS